MLHGVTSFQLDATPICGLSQSAAVIPTARRLARAPARSMPSVTSRLRGFRSSLMRAAYCRRSRRSPAFSHRRTIESVKVDGSLTDNLSEIANRARQLEAAGYDGAYTLEGPHDPFLPVLLAAEHTERLELSTAIAVAFARNPMTLAQTAYDLQSVSEGRFIVGLGSHIRPHIETAVSMAQAQPT